MIRLTGKHALMQMLRAEGVKYIFGNPGTSESPIMSALESYPELKYVLVLQEGVAMGMADAYGRATGQPAFVNLHIETGLANGISLLHNAAEGGAPLVLTAGNKDSRELSHGRTDLARMVRQFTKWSAEVTRPEQVPYAIRRAFNEAKTPPSGPTFVAFSADGLDDEADVEIRASLPGPLRAAPDLKAIQDAARLLSSANAPIILVGDRLAASGGSAEAVRLVELIGARVYTPYYSEMGFPTNHPQYLGNLRLGLASGKQELSKGDVVLAVGRISSGYYMLSQPELVYFGHSSSLIHLDSDARELGKSQATDVAILADPRIALAQLVEAVDAEMGSSDRQRARERSQSIESEKASLRASREQRMREHWEQAPMTPERMMFEVARVLPADTVVADDAITSTAALQQALAFDKPGSIYGGRGGAIGWGMGGGLGLKLAFPDRPVVAFVGDGSAMMTVQGLWTAANENLPIVYIVCNNGAYRILKLNMDAYRELVYEESNPSRYLGMDFTLPLDLAAMARAQGVFGRRIEDPDELGPAVSAALESGKPALLDVVIDGSL